MENSLPPGFKLDSPDQPGSTSDLPPGFELDEKYGEGAQGLIGAAEQVAKGAFGPLATAAEVNWGVPREDILKRERGAGESTKFLGQTAGLIASSFIPGGQARVLSKLGSLAKVAPEATAIAKIGSAAAQGIIENAAYEAGTGELSKWILKDPEQTTGTALLNITGAGLMGGILGGSIGAVHPMWTATAGPKTESFLRSFSNRVNGEGLPKSADLETLASALEIEGKSIAPEMKAALSGDQKAFETFQRLRESGNSSGDALRRTLDEFRSDTSDQMSNIFQSEEKLTSFEAGEKAKEAILNKAEQINSQVEANYNKISTDRNAIIVPDKPRLQFYDELIKKGQDFGAAGGPGEKLFNHYAERALSQDSIAQLDKLRTEIFSDLQVARRAGDFEKSRALGDIRDLIGDFQDRQIGQATKQLKMQAGLSEVEADLAGKQLIKDTQIAKKSYASFIDTISEIASSGKLGKVKSYGQLIEALDRIPSAQLAEKLFNPKNLESLRYLKSNFTDVFEAITKMKKQSLVDAATSKGPLMYNSLLDKVNKLPKEVRELMFTFDELKLINASGALLRKSAERINPSGTAGTLQKLLGNLPAGVGATAGAILGKNPIISGLIAQATKYLGGDLPDAIGLAMLKKMGSSASVDAPAFKAMSDYISSAIKGELKLQKAAKSLVNPVRTTFPSIFIPDSKSREKTDKKLKDLKSDNSKIFEIGGKIGHYTPEYTQALSKMSMQAINYIESMRPNETRALPFDKDPKVSNFEKSRYNRVLDIAEQPFLVMKSINDGTVTSNDVVHLKSLYPSIYSQMQSALFSAIAEKHEDDDIPYKKRLGIAIFLGQPLDSTMLPQNILAAQSGMSNDVAKTQVDQMPQKQSPKDMQKLAGDVATPGQKREMARV